jgi:hypothetical protein
MHFKSESVILSEDVNLPAVASPSSSFRIARAFNNSSLDFFGWTEGLDSGGELAMGELTEPRTVDAMEELVGRSARDRSMMCWGGSPGGRGGLSVEGGAASSAATEARLRAGPSLSAMLSKRVTHVE